MSKIRAMLTMIMLTLFLCAIFMCNGCGGSGKEIPSSEQESSVVTSVHTHTFEKWGRDEDYHWQLCDCGAVLERTEHDYGDWQKDEDKHWRECYCGAIIEEGEHTAEDWIPNGYEHYKVCECGKELEKGAHSFHEWKILDDQHYEVCICGYILTQGSHTYGNWGFNEYEHWGKCECGDIKESEVHHLNENNQCRICSMYYGSAGLSYQRSSLGDYYIVTVAEEITLSGKIFVAANYEGKEVKGIGMYAFMGQSITEIVLPESIEIIEKMAFANCQQLATVHLKGRVEEIQVSAFYDCKQLDNISLPASLKKIGYSAFEGCQSLSTVSFSQKNGWVAWTKAGDESYEITSDVFLGNTADYLTGKELLGVKGVNLMLCDWIAA